MNLYNYGKKLLKTILCEHTRIDCVTNFHGDMINSVSTSRKIYRSAWICKDCRKIIFKERLEPSCSVINWNIHK